MAKTASARARPGAPAPICHPAQIRTFCLHGLRARTGPNMPQRRDRDIRRDGTILPDQSEHYLTVYCTAAPLRPTVRSKVFGPTHSRSVW